MKSFTIAFAIAFAAVASGNIIIESEHITDWGVWGSKL